MSRNFIVLDTEGVNVGKPNPNNLGDNAKFYDFGFIVANREGEILDKFSFVNTDVFNDFGLMSSAYYADKLPQYHEGIGDLWIPASTREIWDVFCKTAIQYDVRDVWAYNAQYDKSCTNFTIKCASNGFRRFFAPYGCKWRDIWDYAGSTICNTSKYVKWCRDNGFISKSGNPSTTADTVGKYLRGTLDYQECHTALSDAEDETMILLAAMKRHQKARHSMGQGWRDSSKIAKQLRTTA